jgi:hypothetical protein
MFAIDVVIKNLEFQLLVFVEFEAQVEVLHPLGIQIVGHSLCLVVELPIVIFPSSRQQRAKGV